MAIYFKILGRKANILIRLFLWSLILQTTQQLTAQSADNHQLKSAYSHYLNFQLDSCNYHLKQLPAHPLSFYLKSLNTSTIIFLDDTVDHFTEKKYIEDVLLGELDTLKFNEQNTNFLKSEIKLQWAILKLKNGEEFAAFWGFKQAYGLAKENVNKYPEYIPSYKTLGLLHVLYDIFPEKYNWILAIFGLKGDVTAGLSELNKVQQSNHFLSAESQLIIALLHAYLLNDPEEAVNSMKALYGRNEYLLIDYTFSLILMKNNQSSLALDIISKSLDKYPRPLAIPQLYYLKAEICMQRGSLLEAIENYLNFLSAHQGINLIKDTYYKIGICYLILEMPAESNHYFENSKQHGWAKNEADKHAKSALENEPISNRQLYQLRYATDGGFYEKAFKIKQNIDPSNLNDHDLTEYYYRSARLFHHTGDTRQAKEYYLLTIDFQKPRDWYFAPNSALQLGLIYKAENNKEKAKKYLKIINNYRGYPYQNSIRQKAKTTPLE